MFPASIGKAGGDEQIPPVGEPQPYRVVQLAQIALGDDEGGDLDAFDVDGVPGLVRKDPVSQSRQRGDHLGGVVGEVSADATPYPLGDLDHSSRSHAS